MGRKMFTVIAKNKIALYFGENKKQTWKMPGNLLKKQVLKEFKWALLGQWTLGLQTEKVSSLAAIRSTRHDLKDFLPF